MKREITARLQAWKNRKDRKPLIVKGARQVGKTYSLKEFGETYFPAYHYVNFEEDEQLKKIFEPDLKPERIIDELNFYLKSSINIKKDLLVFDEIQYCPRALTSLKYFSEKLPEMAICSAGSLLGLYFGLTSFPVGKVDFLNMHPMSFPEFLLGAGEVRAYDFLMNCRFDTQIPDIIHSSLWELLKIYFVTGGLPEVVKIYGENETGIYEALQSVRVKQNDLILAYQADIAKHSGKQNSMHINRVWKNIPSQLARQQNGSAPKFKFKGVIPGIKGYSRLSGAIDWLITAELVLKTNIVNSGKLPFTAFAEDNIFKLYFFDVGILGAISKLPPETILAYEYGTYKGYFAENFAAQEFRCAGVDELFGWREATAEVEFLRETGGKVIPIEIKSGWVTQSKSMKSFAQKYSPDYRTIMSAKNLHIDLENKLHHYPLYLASAFPLPAKG